MTILLIFYPKQKLDMTMKLDTPNTILRLRTTDMYIR